MVSNAKRFDLTMISTPSAKSLSPMRSSAKRSHSSQQPEELRVIPDLKQRTQVSLGYSRMRSKRIEELALDWEMAAVSLAASCLNIVE